MRKYHVDLLFALFPTKVNSLDVKGSLHVHVNILFQAKWESKKYISISESSILRNPFSCLNYHDAFLETKI